MADSGMVPDLPRDSGPNTLVRHDPHMMEVVVVRVAQKPLKDRLGIAQNSGAVEGLVQDPVGAQRELTGGEMDRDPCETLRALTYT
jgi:hypothetical protein